MTGAVHDKESARPAQLAVLVAIALYAALPGRVTLGPGWLMPGLEGLLVLPLALLIRHRHPGEPRWRRVLASLTTGVVAAANTVALGTVIHEITGGGPRGGKGLLVAALQIWLTNVIVFGLWFWELDRGGPGARIGGGARDPDFLFPQMQGDAPGPEGWQPKFLDYLYVAFTNGTAFSPTDAMPVSRAAKALMAVEAAIALLTVIVVLSRAVNVLS